MKFNLLKNKEKNANLNSAINERTREKFILKEWVESSRKATCTKKGTRGFLCRLHKLILNGKMTFSCPTTCTDSYTRRENRCQIPFKTSLTPFKMDFSTGRSMVEMLGVLAIIGVLSIGGIYGYTIAMRRYRANEIVNLMSKYAFIIYSHFNVLNNNGKIIISDYSFHQDKIYTCKSNYNWDTSCYSNFYNSTDFNNLGLGALPTGIRGIENSFIFPQNYKYPFDRVQISIYFYDKELCQTVANLLEAYDSVSDKIDSDPIHKTGNYCDGIGAALVKDFPIDAIYKTKTDSDAENSSYHSDDSYW